jgi:hypothetical protein
MRSEKAEEEDEKCFWQKRRVEAKLKRRGEREKN